MIIKNWQAVDYKKHYKAKFFEFGRSVAYTCEKKTVTLNQLLVFQVIFMLPYISILFKYEDHFPKLPSQILRSFILSDLTQNFGVQQDISYAIVMSFTAVIALLSVMHLIFEGVPDSLTTFYSFLIKLAHFLLVPLVGFGVKAFQDIILPFQSPGSIVLSCLALLLMSWVGLMVCLQAYFQIRMLRKRSSFWSLNNQVHFYGLIFAIFKTITICLNQLTLFLCFISLAFWFFHRQIRSGSVNQVEAKIEYSIYNYIAVADLAVALSFIFRNPYLSFGTWVVGVLFVAGGCIMSSIQKQEHTLYFPGCNNDPEAFYDFFYTLKEEFKAQNMSQTSKQTKIAHIFHLHTFHCPKQQCRLIQHKNAELMTEADLQAMISDVLASKKDQKARNRIIYQLWNLELGKKCVVNVLAERQFLDIHQAYVIAAIDRMMRDSQLSMQTNQENKHIIIKVFFDLIVQIADHYAQFYQELSKAYPVINVLSLHGCAVHAKIARLKDIYAQMLKLKLINFKMIDFYIEFMTTFIKEKPLDQDDIDRLAKLQQNIFFQDISENHLPTLTFYPETGNIENVNAQAQKFLQATRFELKCKSLYDITMPALSIETAQSLAQQPEDGPKQREPVYCLFNIASKQYKLGQLKVTERCIKSKKLLVVEIISPTFSSLKNVFLVDESFSLKHSIRKQVRVKRTVPRSGPIRLNWEEIYYKYVVENSQKIKTSRMVKILADIKDCAIVVKRLKCTDQKHYILEVQLLIQQGLQNQIHGKRSSIGICTPKKAGSQKSSKVEKGEKFAFHYVDDNHYQKTVIYGFKGEANETVDKLRKKTLSTCQHGTKVQLVDRLIKMNHDYTRDIKTYRLYEGDLYNVDLQDRQAYNQMFEAKKIEQTVIEEEENSNFQLCISFGVILLGLVLVGLSAFLIIYFQSSTDQLKYLSSQHCNIDSLMLDLNRVLSLLTDLASGFSDKFPLVSIPSEIQQSYQRIQSLKGQPLFDTVQHQLQIEGTILYGSLMELIDALFAHINQILNGGELTMIQVLHSSTTQFIQEIQEAQSAAYQNLEANFSTLTTIKNIVLILSIAVLVGQLALNICFFYHSSNKLKSRFSYLLFMSDAQAHTHQENASKMKYAAEMIRKNFKLDTQNILITGTDAKKRKHPKKIVLSNECVLSVVLLGLAALAVHVVCGFLLSNQFDNSLKQFLAMKQSSKALIWTYTGQSEFLNQITHYGQPQSGQLAGISEATSYVIQHRSSFEFSPQLNSFINSIYFKDSCSLLLQGYNMSSQVCQNTTPQFTIKNPFQIGLAYYLIRQKYYFGNNVTQTFAHLSIRSHYFIEVMTNISQQIEIEGDQTVKSIKQTTNIMNYIIIVIDVTYVLGFFGLFFFFRVCNQRIKIITDFFKEKIVLVDDEPYQAKTKRSLTNKSATEVIDTQEQVGEKSVTRRTDRNRRRTTIENNLPGAPKNVTIAF